MEGQPVRVEVTADLEGQRLDKLLVSQIDGLGRAVARKLFASGRVQLLTQDGRRARCRKGDVAAAGSVIEVSLQLSELDLVACPDVSLALDVVRETKDLVIVSKPAGVASAPLRSGELGCIANGLLARYPEMASVGYSTREPGLCHRLDTNTSGLLMAARNQECFEKLTGAIRAGELDKRYLAICEPTATSELAPSATIELRLGPDPSNGRRVAVVRRRGRMVQTSYRIIRRKRGLVLVDVSMAQGYRHQIRAHFAAIGAPLVGDVLYGATPRPELGRHALHASRIGWRGDAQLARFTTQSSLPKELEALLR